MINLLPDDTKKQIRAARMNVVLIRYIIIIGGAAIFLLGISIGSYLLLTTIRDNAQSIIDTNQTKANEYGTVQSDANALQASLSSAKSLFDQQIDYPKILTTIGSLAPSGVILDGLDLNPQTLTAPIDIQVYAKTTDAATAFKTALESNQAFNGIAMKSLSSSNGLPDYPVNAVITVTINKDNLQ